jgi:hypothetical protein
LVSKTCIRHLLVDGSKKADIEDPFERGEVNYTLDGVSIHPVHTKDTGVFPKSVAREEGNRSGISP